MLGFKKSPEARLKRVLEQLNAGDLDEAMPKLLEMAKAGNATAEYWLGDVHEFILKKPEEAARWYGRAAEHGHARSQWCLANLHMTGRGTELDPDLALRLYRLAAEQHVPEAQYAVGESYRLGTHIEQNADQALYWYQRAADAGFEPAKTRIEEHWPGGLFRARFEGSCKGAALDAGSATALSGPLARVREQVCVEASDGLLRPTDPAVMALYHLILEAGREHGYLPEKGVPFVPELLERQTKTVLATCGSLHGSLAEPVLGGDELLGAFRFVFARGCDALYEWHASTSGEIEKDVAVGDPLAADPSLRMPADLQRAVAASEAPRVVYGVTSSWWAQHQDRLGQRGVDLWTPLAVSLATTFAIAVSIALKHFGYRK